MSLHNTTVSVFNCPRLLRGILKMHSFAYSYEHANASEAKRILLRFIGSHLGMWHMTDAEGEQLEMMSFNSGATFSPVDAFVLLDPIYQYYETVTAIDCTLNTLTVAGIPCERRDWNLTDIQDIAETQFTDISGLESEWEPAPLIGVAPIYVPTDYG